MKIDTASLAGMIDLTNPTMVALVDIIKPYLPALKRMGSTGVDLFVESVQEQDWARIDRALYAEMTEDERDAISSAVLRSARMAVRSAYNRDQALRDDMFRVVLGIVLTFI